MGGVVMHYCEDCGSELPANARFCGRCGRRTEDETEETTNLIDIPIEDIPISPLASSTALRELQDPASDNDKEEEQQTPNPTSENDGERQTPVPVSDNDKEEEQQTPNPALENDEEQQPQHTLLEPTSSQPGDVELELEDSANQNLDEHSELDQVPLEKAEMGSPHSSAPKRGRKSISKCLLILLVVLIVAVGGAVALIGLFYGHLPGMGGTSNALSSPSVIETISSAGPSLTASVCASSSTPSASGTSNGLDLTLSAASGCSSFNAALSTSSCLVYPYNAGASYRYILDVSNATVTSNAYHLVLSIAEYTGPTTYNDAVHVAVGIGEGSTGRNFSWIYRSGNVIINSDEHSGTMDVILASGSNGNTIRLVGDWACSLLIKNP
jgi:hypothetical protein